MTQLIEYVSLSVREKVLKKERREFFRLKAYQLGKYRVISPEERKLPIVDAIKDIGGGGVCFRVDEDLPISSIVELQINVPFLDQPLRTLVKVIWKKRMGKSNKYEIGAQFLEIEEVHRKKIVEHIELVKEKIYRWKHFFRRLFKGGGERR